MGRWRRALDDRVNGIITGIELKDGTQIEKYSHRDRTASKCKNAFINGSKSVNIEGVP